MFDKITSELYTLRVSQVNRNAGTPMSSIREQLPLHNCAATEDSPDDK